MTHDSADHITVDNRFAMIPHWLITSDISDGALRLYMVLTKYADGTTKQAFPSRGRLAKDMRKTVKSVDRYLKELEALGAVRVLRRKRAGSKENMSSLYTLVTVRPPVDSVCDLQCEPHSEPQCTPHTKSHNPQKVGTTLSPPSPTDVAENYTHLSIPTDTSYAIALGDDRLTPSPNGDDRSLHAQMGITKEQAAHLIDEALKLYMKGELYDEDVWDYYIQHVEDLTGVYIGHSVANNRWDERLWEIINANLVKGQRYGASIWLAMVYHYSK